MPKTDSSAVLAPGLGDRLPAIRPRPARAAHRQRHRGHRQPGQHRRSPHRLAAGHLTSRPAARTGLRPGPGPFRRDRRDRPDAENAAAHARLLRHLHRPVPGRPAAGILHQPRHRPRPDQRELRQRLRPDRPSRRDARPVPRPGQGRPRPPRTAWPETHGPRIIALAQGNPDTQTVTLIFDATTASTACSPSPPTPTNEKPTSAKSSATAKPSPKAPTADATARPSPPAKRESPTAPSRRTRLPDRPRAQRHVQGARTHQIAPFF
jgi:hypothetical protein